MLNLQMRRYVGVLAVTLSLQLRIMLLKIQDYSRHTNTRIASKCLPVHMHHL